MDQKKIQIIGLTPQNIAEYGVCGYKDVKKHLELRRKIDWFKKYYPLGLRIKAVIAESGEYQGMLEYIPGEYAHRPSKRPAPSEHSASLEMGKSSVITLSVTPGLKISSIKPIIPETEMMNIHNV